MSMSGLLSSYSHGCSAHLLCMATLKRCQKWLTMADVLCQPFSHASHQCGHNSLSPAVLYRYTYICMGIHVVLADCQGCYSYPVIVLQTLGGFIRTLLGPLAIVYPCCNQPHLPPINTFLRSASLPCVYRQVCVHTSVCVCMALYCTHNLHAFSYTYG